MVSTVNSRELPVYVVDAFSDSPFSGNPAALFILENDKDISDDTKQKLANEMNVADTAFVSKINSNESLENAEKLYIRWFTPTKEVELCGHATLAAAAVLFSCYGYRGDTLTFETLRSGTLQASKRDTKVVLDLPSNEPKPVHEKFKDLAKVASCNLPVVDVQISPLRNVVVRLEDEISRAEFESLRPDITALLASTAEDLFGVILTVKGSNEYDFYSRFFAPWFGIDEDPVCGSAHTVLTPYWANILGKKDLLAHQCSKRGGDLYLKLRGDGRVEIAGDYKIVLKGSVFL